MSKFNVRIKGIVPILQARHITPIEEKQITNLKQSKQKTREVTDDEQYEMHAYKKNGKYYQPSQMIEAAMTKAAVEFRMEGKKTFKNVINGGIIVDPIEIIHKSQKFVPHTIWGKNKNTGGAVWVVRPMIEDWELEFTINLLQDERVSEGILKEILTYAGMYVGIGAWRPKYGRFEIVSWKEVK